MTPVPRGGSVCEPSEHDDFDNALLAYSMKVFGASSAASDLQVDWSSDGLGFINPGDAVPSASLACSGCVSGWLPSKDPKAEWAIRYCYINPVHFFGRYGLELEDGKQIAMRPCNMRRCLATRTNNRSLEKGMKVPHSPGNANIEDPSVTWFKSVSSRQC
jgi:hypothetical protein